MLEHRWTVDRPKVLVVACSDGRLQEVTDDFLSEKLGIVRYDRLYAPGGGGALAHTGRDFTRAQQMRTECRYLIELHQIERTILLFHGPAPTGSPDAMCADYVRKLPQESVETLLKRQAEDAHELRLCARDWAVKSTVEVYRCEVDAEGVASFVILD